MSSLAKQAREAMKAKASRLTTADPHLKVDSSTWTPAEPLNTEVKTGMRPVSRRAFKSGGKVTGTKAKTNLGKKARNSGGKAITADSLINRNAKEANEERPGGKAHIGGYKKGGRLKRNTGGTDQIKKFLEDNPDPKPEAVPLPPPRPKNLDAPKPERFKDPYDHTTQGAKRGGKAEKCWGGKAKKADGGSLEAAKQMMMQAQKTAGVPSSGIYGAGFTRTGAGSMSPAGALGKQKLKKGGAPKHDDVKQDMALIKKMVKPSARTARKEGGGVFSGTSYPGKIPGVVPGGREARATGGKTKGKGKTHINIMIAAGKPGMGDMMPPGGPTPPPGMDGGPGGVAPVPMAPPPGGAPMPMPFPMPMPMAGGAPAGGPPMPRKAGGRITKAASSYKDMEAGAAGGEGRLQKTEIAKKHKGAPTFKKGGKVYRSYKDMDAGSGSGLGRMEKTEIQKRKE
jgi:hypothetical protein